MNTPPFIPESHPDSRPDSHPDSHQSTRSGALRERFWTALALALMTTGAVLWLPTPVLAVVLLPVIGLAAWELAPLLGLFQLLARVAYLLALLVLLGLGWITGMPAELLLLPVAVFWCALAPTIFRFVVGQLVTPVDWPMLALSVPVILAPWIGVAVLHGAESGGPWLVLFLLMLVWLTDTGAYFAGRRFGRHKLAPRLSPAKTTEGVIGGLLAAGLWSLVLIPLAGSLFSWLWLAALSLLSAGVSVVGDLLESWLKRRRNLKDAGSLLPGHGGMLDRLDSLIAAVPVFSFGFLLWEKTL